MVYEDIFVKREGCEMADRIKNAQKNVQNSQGVDRLSTLSGIEVLNYSIKRLI
jgi:hypothetical protein